MWRHTIGSAFALMLSALLMVAIVMSGLALANNQRQARNERHQICMAINGTRSTLSQYFDLQFNRARLNLPKLQYYRDHPAELLQQLQLLNKQQRELNLRLRPLPCNL